MIRTLPIPLPSRETALESAETRESRAFRRRLPAFYVPAQGAPSHELPPRVACAVSARPSPESAPIPAPDHDAHVRAHREYLASVASIPSDARTLRTIGAAIDAAGPSARTVTEGLQWPLPRETAVVGRDAIAARLERSAYLAGAPVPAYDTGATRAERWATDHARLVAADRPDAPSWHATPERAPLASDYRAWRAAHGAEHAACLAAGIDPVDAGVPPPPAPDPCAYTSEHSPRGVHCPASLGTSDASKRAARGEPVAWSADTTAYRATHRAALMDAVRAAPSNRAARDPYHALRAACLRDGVPVPSLSSLRSG